MHSPEISLSDTPHPLLIPLLDEHGITWEQFRKKGRPAPGVREKRATIVTTLHRAGTTWEDMTRITGLSLMGIQRLTEAVGNGESRKNRAEAAAQTGRSRRGESKPWLSDRMRDAWSEGKFEFHRGRTRSPEERARVAAGWTPESRQSASAAHVQLWTDSSYRDRLLAFHRSPEERARRSREQARRIAEDPEKWTRGKGSYVKTTRCRNGDRIWVRSTYEVAAVKVLETDSAVCSYTYEPRLQLPDGTEIRPDFVVRRSDGVQLVEVKASWVLNLPPEHKVARRLRRAQDEATRRGWSFYTWTEQDVLHAAL